MKTTLLALFILLGSTCFAQQDSIIGSIKYVRVLSFGAQPSETEFDLFLGTSGSFFVENQQPSQDNEVKIEESSEDEFDLTYNISFRSQTAYAVDLDLEEKTIRSRTNLFENGESKTIIVVEDLPAINWQIGSESKTIGGLNCQMATCTFRGREYTAWFCKMIPSTLGPWKFHGLPGLILEISDKTKEVMFYAKEIKFPYDAKDKSLLPDLGCNPDLPVYSRKEYLTLQEKQGEEMMNMVNARLPRGAIFTPSRVTSTSIELEYEFEQ